MLRKHEALANQNYASAGLQWIDIPSKGKVVILLVASCLGNWVQLQLGEQPDLSKHLFFFSFFLSAAVHEHSLFAANGERIGTSYVLQEGVNVIVTL